MSKASRLVALIAAIAASHSVPVSAQNAPVEATAETPDLALPPGTHIPLVLTQELSSRRHTKGDLVTLEVAQDIRIDDVVAIPSGTPVVAQITVAEKKGAMGRGGRLEAKPLYLEMPQGPVRLSGRLGTDGKSNTGAATAATALITGFAFVITGKSAVIPAGTEMTAVLDRPVRLSTPRSAQAASLSASSP